MLHSNALFLLQNSFLDQCKSNVEVKISDKTD